MLANYCLIIQLVSFSEDSQFVYTGGKGNVKVWDIGRALGSASPDNGVESKDNGRSSRCASLLALPPR